VGELLHFPNIIDRMAEDQADVVLAAPEEVSQGPDGLSKDEAVEQLTFDLKALMKKEEE
jgi:hypothetical protein